MEVSCYRSRSQEALEGDRIVYPKLGEIRKGQEEGDSQSEK